MDPIPPPPPSAPRQSRATVILSIWMAVITLSLIGGVIHIWPMAYASFAHEEKEPPQTAPGEKEPETSESNGDASALIRSDKPDPPAPAPPEGDARISQAAAERAAMAAEEAKASAKHATEAAEQAKKTEEEARKSLEQAKMIAADARPFGPEGTILVLILLLGAAGAQIHAVQSFADFVGNGSFTSRWVIWYLKRPVIGALLALTVYAVVRGGVVDSDAPLGNAEGTLWGLTAICLLSGMFSRLVTDKLYEVFATLLAAGVSRNDGMKDDAPETKPVLVRLEPATVSATTPVPVKIIGRNFTKPSKVRVGDQDLDVKFISGTELELPAAGLPMKPGKYGISVIDPATKTGSAPPVDLEITP